MKKYIIATLLLGASFGLAFAQTSSILSHCSYGDPSPDCKKGDVAPPSTSQCISLSNNLSLRSRDSSTNGEVSTLQGFLQENGFLASDPTGYFGNLTLNAVKAFQNQYGLLSYGYVGPVTRQAIQKATCGDNVISTVPTVEFIGTPTLGLEYDSNGKETFLVGKATVKITAGNTPMTTYNSSVGYILSFSGASGLVGSNSVIYSVSGPDSTNNNVTIPANTSATFYIRNTVKPSELFSGSYHLQPNGLTYNFSSNNYQTVSASSFVNAQPSNSVTIIGETSPYISSITPPSSEAGLDGKVNITGVRFDPNTNLVSVGGIVLTLPSTNNGTTISFTPGNNGISVGSYVVQVSNGNGASNKVALSLITNNTTTQNCPSGYVLQGSSCVIQPTTTSGAPTCTITSEASNVTQGGSFTIRWTSNTAAVSAFLSDFSSSQRTVSTNGSALISTASITSPRSITEYITVTSSNGQQSTCGASVNVVAPGTVITSSPTATIDQSSLTPNSSSPTITGTASNVSTNNFVISIQGSGYNAFISNNISVANGRWSVSVPTVLRNGTYTVSVLSNNQIITSGTLTILANTVSATTPPTLSITTFGSTLSGSAPLQVSLTANNLQPTNANEAYAIDWGDGSTPSIIASGCTSATDCITAGSSHVYQAAAAVRTVTLQTTATYTAKLHKYTSVGCSGCSIQTLVNNSPVLATGDTVTVTDVPQIYLSASPTSGTSPLTVTFSNLVPTNASVGAPYTLMYAGGNANRCSPVDPQFPTSPIGACTTLAAGAQTTYSYIWQDSNGDNRSPDTYQARLVGSAGQILGVTNITVSKPSTTTQTAPVTTTSPTGTITASPASCVIPQGSSSCNVTLNWNTNNPVNTSTITNDNNRSIISGNSGSQSVTMSGTYAYNTYYLANNGVLLAQVRINSTCATGSVWNVSSCVAVNTTPVTTTYLPAIPISSGSCSGTTASFNWPAVSGATSYQTRINDTTAGTWTGSCNTTENGGNYCNNSETSTSHSWTGISGHSYNAWVHACNSAGCSNASTQPTFSCPTVTSSPVVTQTSTNVQPSFTSPPHFSASPISSTGNTTFSWTAQNASYCNVSHPDGSSPWNNAPTTYSMSVYGGSYPNGLTTTVTCYGSTGISIAITANLTVTQPTSTVTPSAPATCSGADVTTGSQTVTPGTSGAVWGSGPFTTDSSLSVIAKFLGATGSSATLSITNIGCQSSFTGASANGITTQSYGSWHGMNVTCTSGCMLASNSVSSVKQYVIGGQVFDITAPATCKSLLPISRGSWDSNSNGSVTVLQKFLAKKYNLFVKDAVTGYYGDLTVENVKKFQAENNLETTGYVGPATRTLIKNMCTQ